MNANKIKNAKLRPCHALDTLLCLRFLFEIHIHATVVEAHTICFVRLLS